MIKSLLKATSNAYEGSLEHADAQRVLRELYRVKMLGIGALVGIAAWITLALSACAPLGGSVQPAVEAESAELKSPLLVEITSLRQAPEIRVLMRAFSNAGEISVGQGSRLEFPNSLTRPAIDIEANQTVRIVKEGRGLRVEPPNLQPFLAQEVRILPRHSGRRELLRLVVNDSLFEGQMNVFLDSRGDFAVVNTVSTEAYCRGSVGWEMIPGWPLEALKAQAVAIRTYTLFTIFDNQRRNVVRHWDVDDTTAFLRYGGGGSLTNPRDRRLNDNVELAVARTEGQVALYQGRLFKAFFHSTSGGYTSSVATAFGTPSIRPLRGVMLGSAGSSSKMYRWKHEVDRTLLESRLKERGYQTGTIVGIEPIVNDPSGFARDITVIGASASIVIPAGDFRTAIGTGVNGLPSTNFSCEVRGSVMVFEGRGWGHGVGLDQWACHDLAKEGKDYQTILEVMYPGITVTRPWQQ